MLLQKNMHRKNNVPQILPPLIALKIFGSVIKIRLGPCPGFTPNAKHAGKMIIPAISATQVSRIVTQIASPCQRPFLINIAPKIAIAPIPRLSVKKDCPMAA